jgi:hypothetical protein
MMRSVGDSQRSTMEATGSGLCQVTTTAPPGAVTVTTRPFAVAVSRAFDPRSALGRRVARAAT